MQNKAAMSQKAGKVVLILTSLAAHFSTHWMKFSKNKWAWVRTWKLNTNQKCIFENPFSTDYTHTWKYWRKKKKKHSKEKSYQENDDPVEDAPVSCEAAVGAQQWVLHAVTTRRNRVL